jgi:type VI secretion system secreted protein VgrG
VSELEDIEIDQTGRLISVEASPLGTHKLLVCAFEGREELSKLSRFRLEVVTMGRALKPSEVLGQKLTVALRAVGEVRKFSGIVGSFSALTTSVRGQFLHVMELVPPAWLLTLNQRCQIFHDTLATDIVDKTFHEAGLDSQVKTSGESREYCVQYAESDFNFIARLLEEEGLFFRFDHAADSCTVIVGNGASDYQRMAPDTLQLNRDVQKWQHHYSVGPSSFKHGDWDFKAVNVIEGDAKSLPKVQPPGLPDRDFYEYPGSFATSDGGRQLARTRMEEHEAQFVRIEGASVTTALQTGMKFKLQDQTVDLPARDQTSDQFVVLSVDHRCHDYSGCVFEGETKYTNEFTCMPADLGFRPARVTAKPSITGPQTATVTDGPDEYGRSKVRFHWFAQDTSCWTRVAQNWAYNQMGTQFLPRVDSEVVVEFLGGDPDRPLIVGMVYNGNNKLPYDVPANKTQSGIRGANWGDAGVADTSNELRFEDRDGSEEIYLHAQKDFRRVVVNDDALTVEQGKRTVDVKQGNLEVTVDTGDYKTEVQTGNLATTVDTGDYTTKVSTGNHSTTVSLGDHTTKVSTGNHSTKLSVGNHEVKMDVGSSSIEALQSITLKVGANSLTIDQTGVSIKGLMVKVEGQAMLDMKSPMTTVNADAMLTLKGGITMVN